MRIVPIPKPTMCSKTNIYASYSLTNCRRSLRLFRYRIAWRLKKAAVLFLRRRACALSSNDAPFLSRLEYQLSDSGQARIDIGGYIAHARDVPVGFVGLLKEMRGGQPPALAGVQIGLADIRIRNGDPGVALAVFVRCAPSPPAEIFKMRAGAVKILALRRRLGRL